MKGKKRPPLPKFQPYEQNGQFLLRADVVPTKDPTGPYAAQSCGKSDRERSCSKAAGSPLLIVEKTQELDIFENPHGPPDPRSPKTPQQQKKKFHKKKTENPDYPQK